MQLTSARGETIIVKEADIASVTAPSMRQAPHGWDVGGFFRVPAVLEMATGSTFHLNDPSFKTLKELGFA